MNPLIKLDVANHLLGKGSIFVHLDPRAEKARCPPWLKQQPQLVLQMGLSMAISIPDLRVDEEGIFGTLSFNRSPFACFCPWDAIFAIIGDEGRGQVWPESMPAEIAAEVANAEVAREANKSGTPQPDARASGTKTRRGKRLPAGWRIIK
jgi:hypothetical protein